MNPSSAHNRAGYSSLQKSSSRTKLFAIIFAFQGAMGINPVQFWPSMAKIYGTTDSFLSGLSALPQIGYVFSIFSRKSCGDHSERSDIQDLFPALRFAYAGYALPLGVG